PRVAGAAAVAAGWGDDVAAVASQVDAGQRVGDAGETAGGVAHLAAGMPVDEMEAAPAGEGRQCLGQASLEGLKVDQRMGAAVGRVDVDDDDAGGGAGGEADVGPGPAVPPGADRALVGGGLAGAMTGDGMLGGMGTVAPAAAPAGHHRVERKDGPAAGGVVEGGRQGTSVRSSGGPDGEGAHAASHFSMSDSRRRSWRSSDSMRACCSAIRASAWANWAASSSTAAMAGWFMAAPFAAGGGTGAASGPGGREARLGLGPTTAWPCRPG